MKNFKSKFILPTTLILLITLILSGCINENHSETMFPLPEYVPTEPPATTTGTLSYQDITLEQASEIIGREIPIPAYLPAGYAITSIQVESASQPLREWRIELSVLTPYPTSSNSKTKEIRDM